MSSTGNVFPGAGSTVDRAGAAAWTNPGNIVSDNTTNATTTTTPTDYLIASSFGFSSTVPANVSIRGITVRVEMSETGTGSSNYVVQLSSDTTPTLIGNVSGTITVTTGPTISTTGGIADLWGTTLTAAQVRASGFGVTLWSVDTINALQCDYVTIAVEWTDVPQAWSDRQYFRKRKNLTHRRRLDAPLNDQNPPTPSTSNDRALEPGFVTARLRSRRSLSAGWMAALATQPQAPAVPAVSAWLAVQTRRRRDTERRLVVADPTPIERYTPPSIAWSDPPTVKRVEFRRTLQEQAPQLLFPPPTGPPVEYYPAWAASQLPATTQDRRLQRVADAPVYPQTPPATSADRALEAPFVTRTLRSRKLLRESTLVIVAAPVTSEAPLPAWAEQRANTRPRHRTHRRIAELNSYPATPPASTSAVYPSFDPTGFRQRRNTARALQAAAPQPLWPATPAVGAQPITAVSGALKAKRRKHRQGLFLSGGGVIEARVQPQFPSYAVAPTKKRKPLKRRLLRAQGLPSTPQTPAVGAQPVTAWQQPKQHWIERDRAIQAATPQITYPATPPVPPQPPSAWRLPLAFHVEHRRTLQPAAPQITYPRTLVADVATVPVRALKRRETRRTRRIAPHGPQYPATPVPFQAPTAWKLAEAFRRRGWRALLVVAELNERPATPPPAPVTRSGRRIKAGSVGRRGKGSIERTVQAKHARRKLDAD